MMTPPYKLKFVGKNLERTQILTQLIVGKYYNPRAAHTGAGSSIPLFPLFKRVNEVLPSL